LTLRLFFHFHLLEIFHLSRCSPFPNRKMKMLLSSVTVCLLLSTLSVVANGESAVLSLTKELFEQKVKEGPMLVEFFAPWCGHCKHLEPIYEQLATQLKGKIIIAKVDCTVEKETSTDASDQRISDH